MSGEPIFIYSHSEHVHLSCKIEPGSQTEQAPPSAIFWLGPQDMHGFRFLTVSVAPRPVRTILQLVISSNKIPLYIIQSIFFFCMSTLRNFLFSDCFRETPTSCIHGSRTIFQSKGWRKSFLLFPVDQFIIHGTG